MTKSFSFPSRPDPSSSVHSSSRHYSMREEDHSSQLNPSAPRPTSHPVLSVKLPGCMSLWSPPTNFFNLIIISPLNMSGFGCPISQHFMLCELQGVASSVPFNHFAPPRIFHSSPTQGPRFFKFPIGPFFSGSLRFLPIFPQVPSGIPPVMVHSNRLCVPSVFPPHPQSWSLVLSFRFSPLLFVQGSLAFAMSFLNVDTRQDEPPNAPKAAEFTDFPLITTPRDFPQT